MESKKILFVDDDVTNINIFKVFFSDSKYEVVSCTNGVEALTLMADTNFHCVVTDIEMPLMNGIELLKKVVEIDKGIPVILVTKFDNLQNMRAGWENGAFDFIQKPFKKEHIREVVDIAMANGATFNESVPTDRTMTWKGNRISDMVFDQEAFADLLDNESALIVEILNDYNRISKEKMESLKSHLVNGEKQKINECIHFLTGCSENVHGKRVVNVLNNIHSDIKAGGSFTDADLKYLSKEFATLHEEVQKYIDSLNASATAA